MHSKAHSVTQRFPGFREEIIGQLARLIGSHVGFSWMAENSQYAAVERLVEF
jgi:hypothetical protein